MNSANVVVVGQAPSAPASPTSSRSPVPGPRSSSATLSAITRRVAIPAISIRSSPPRRSSCRWRSRRSTSTEPSRRSSRRWGARPTAWRPSGACSWRSTRRTAPSSTPPRDCSPGTRASRPPGSKRRNCERSSRGFPRRYRKGSSSKAICRWTATRSTSRWRRAHARPAQPTCTRRSTACSTGASA